MRIFELADKPYMVTYRVNKDGQVLATFESKSGSIRVGIQKFFSDASLTFSLMLDGKHKLDKTNTGDQFRIFATISNIVERYFEEYNPEYFSFSAPNYEPSKIRLYSRMADRLAQKFNCEFTHNSLGGSTEFMLARI